MAADPDERRTRGPRSLTEDGIATSVLFPGNPRAGPTLLVTAGRQAAVEIYSRYLPVEGGDVSVTYAGMVNRSPNAREAQAIRAFLAAIATMVRQ